MDYKRYIREVPDFPKKGILFYDITTLLMNPDIFSAMINEMAKRVKDIEITKIAAIEASIGLTAEERKWLLIEGWENAVDQLLDNGILAEEKEKHLLDFARRFSLPDSDYKGTDAFMRIVKSAVLRDISNGLGIRGI